jgi:hypothetical protein
MSGLKYSNKELIRVVTNLISTLQSSDLGAPAADGEWAWLNENHRKHFVESLYSGNWPKLQTFLMDPFGALTAFGIISPVEKFSKESKGTNFEADFSLLNSLYPNESSDLLRHGRVFPHPWSTYTEEFMTYPDSPRHAYFAKQIIERVPTDEVGIEIGGGYGGLIYFLKKLGFKQQLIDCDLLETLIVAYIFLELNGISAVLCFSQNQFDLAKNGDSDVILVTPQLFHSIKDFKKIGFGFNSRSLSEMSRASCTDYLDTINLKIKPKIFISENSEELLFPDSERHLENTQDEISKRLTNYSLLTNSRTRFLGGSNRYTLRIHQLAEK